MLFGINIYLVNGSICLAIVILLLSIKTFPESDSTGFYAKRYLTGTAFLNVLMNGLGVAFHLYGLSTDVLYAVVTPAVSLMQLHFIACGLLTKINARSWLLRLKASTILPLPLATALLFAAERNLLPKELVSPILFAIYALAFVVCCTILIMKSRHFIEERKRTEGETACLKYMIVIGTEYVCYFGLTFTALAAQTDMAYVFLSSLIGTAILLHWTASHINQNRVSCIVVRPIEAVPTDNIPTPTTELPNNQKEDTHGQFSESGITETIRHWERHPDKPYLKEGITIADVAEQLGITDVQLSFVLNHSLCLNFSSWLN